MRAPAVVTFGAGRLKMCGYTGDVEYEFKGDPAAVRRTGANSPAAKPLAGLIRSTPDVANSAFKEGRCFLTLEDGREWSLEVVAHTEGADHAFVEARIV